MALRNVLASTALLTGFAVFGVALVTGIADGTREQIAANEEAALRERLHQILPPDRHDNDLLADTLTVSAPELDPKGPATVYIARQADAPVAAVFTVSTMDGYSGLIRLLVGVDAEGRIIGVRVVAHRETPGLGDLIEADRSDWIDRFRGRAIGEPPEAQWKVRRDGGVFDQFTGATITPRAVVGAVKRTLLYFGRHRDELFGKEAGS